MNRWRTLVRTGLTLVLAAAALAAAPQTVEQRGNATRPTEARTPFSSPRSSWLHTPPIL